MTFDEWFKDFTPEQFDPDGNEPDLRAAWFASRLETMRECAKLACCYCENDTPHHQEAEEYHDNGKFCFANCIRRAIADMEKGNKNENNA